MQVTKDEMIVQGLEPAGRGWSTVEAGARDRLVRMIFRLLQAIFFLDRSGEAAETRDMWWQVVRQGLKSHLLGLVEESIAQSNSLRLVEIHLYALESAPQSVLEIVSAAVDPARFAACALALQPSDERRGGPGEAMARVVADLEEAAAEAWAGRLRPVVVEYLGEKAAIPARLCRGADRAAAALVAALGERKGP